jgi:hypothetical protein
MADRLIQELKRIDNFLMKKSIPCKDFWQINLSGKEIISSI